MGVTVHLCWKENGRDKWHYLSKISFYPLELQDYDAPDEQLPSEFDPKYIEIYLEWLKHLQFFINHAPQLYMQYNTCTVSIEQVKECIKEDINAVEEALQIREDLTIKNVKCWLSVG